MSSIIMLAEQSSMIILSFSCILASCLLIRVKHSIHVIYYFFWWFTEKENFYCCIIVVVFNSFIDRRLTLINAVLSICLLTKIIFRALFLGRVGV